MPRRPWTAKEDRVLRKHYPDTPSHLLASRLGRTAQAVRGRARTLGLRSQYAGNGVMWSDVEREYVRTHCRHESAEQIGAVLGRSRQSVHRIADGLGLSRPNRKLTEADMATIKRLAGQGQCNRCIGRQLGVTRCRIRNLRRQLGLPPVTSRGMVATCQPCIEAVRRKTQSQCQQAGVRSLAEIRSREFHEYAAACGWPEDLRPRAVQILNTLWERGPQTRRQLCEAVGLTWRGSRKSICSNDPEGSHLANLAARGLVVCLGRVVQQPGAKNSRGNSSGTNVSLYSIAPGVAPGCFPATATAQPAEV